MSTPNKSNKLMLILGIVAVICAVAAYAIQSKINNQTEDMKTDAQAQAQEETAATSEYIEFDVEAAMKERILGNPSAPIKISEHSSLSCGHCANFHKDVFDDFKESYIDTGRAYLVYSDFPLNPVALHGSMIARCVPEDRYFDFIDMLFVTQADWAFESNYMSLLRQKAADFGVSDELFDACINNEQLRDSIVKGREAASEVWGVDSTPSFVVNNQIKIAGAPDIIGFDENIQDALGELGVEEGEAAAPVGAESSPTEEVQEAPQEDSSGEDASVSANEPALNDETAVEEAKE